VFDVVPTPDGFASGNSFCGGDSTLDCGEFVYNDFGNVTHNPNALGGAIVDCSFPRNDSDPSGPPPRDSECNTVTGLDGPTGLGTPTSLQLFRSTAPTVTLAAPATAKRQVSASFKAATHERLSGIHVTSYDYNFGDGHSTRSGSPTAHHAFARAGTYVVTLTVTDSAHQVVIVRHKVRIS
jgi:PKD repeat protein